VVAQAEPADENAWAFIFASVWGIFVLAVTLLRIAADRSSRVRMKFIRPLELAAGPIIGLVVALMFVSFAACTLLIPINAGQWKEADASDWQKNALTQLMSPFNTAANGFYADELNLENVFNVK
jgi:hypothetical protein